MMPESNECSRRGFLGHGLAAAGTACAAAAAGTQGLSATSCQAEEKEEKKGPGLVEKGLPYGMIGNVKFSRLMLGGNLVSGYMHARDLKYVGRLFRAYVTEEKIMDTFALAEEHGINTVLESGAALVSRYNKQHGGHMQIIPSVHPELGKPDQQVRDEVKQKADAGATALYVWGVAGDRLVREGAVDKIAKAVESIKDRGIPAGVGGHSLQVPRACEKHKVPCDFYVKTLHSDNYPSATPKNLRKEYIWLDGGEGWYDSMWCIDPEDTIEFMKTVAKPWIAFKVLAAGAIPARQGFAHAFDGGADFIGVGMFDFQIKENSELTGRLVQRAKNRPRPWCA